MNRNRSVSSSPDPLAGTPRTTTQSTNPDLDRSPTPHSSNDDPNSSQEENGTSNNSSIPSTRTDSIPVAREISLEAEKEDEEESRESPSFEGVKFSSSFGPPLSSIDTPKNTSSDNPADDNSSPGRARRLDSDRPGAQAQPIRKRTTVPTAASLQHRLGSSSSRNIQSRQIPSTNFASKTDLMLSHHETTSVTSPRLPGGKGTQQPRVQASSQAMQHRREPPPRSRSARVEDRLATRTVVPPRGLALPGPIPKIEAPVGKAPYPSSSTSKDLGLAEVGSSSPSQRPVHRKLNTSASLAPATRPIQSSAQHEEDEEEEEDSIEALRNTGPIRSSRKDDLRSDSRAYIYGLPGSSTLFGSDFSKASLPEDDEDVGGFDLGEEFGMSIGMATGVEGGSEEEKDDSLRRGLIRRRRSGSGGTNTRELTRGTETSPQGVRTSISRPRSIVSAGQEASASIPNAIALHRPRTGRPRQDVLQTVFSSSLRSVTVPSTSQVFPANSNKSQSTRAPISDQHASEQDIDHRTISTRRAPRRIPSVVYKPRTRRNTAEREIPLSASEGEEQELPSLEDLDLPSAPVSHYRTKIPKKRHIRIIESEESEEKRPRRLATKKRRAVQKENPIKKTRSEVDERTESERKHTEERLKRIKEIDNYELEVDYVV